LQVVGKFQLMRASYEGKQDNELLSNVVEGEEEVDEGKEPKYDSDTEEKVAQAEEKKSGDVQEDAGGGRTGTKPRRVTPTGLSSSLSSSSSAAKPPLSVSSSSAAKPPPPVRKSSSSTPVKSSSSSSMQDAQLTTPLKSAKPVKSPAAKPTPRKDEVSDEDAEET
jgi:hypothetical protein